MTTRTITAMQVIAVMNSYMLPHGTRCSEMPRVRMPVTWAARPMQVSVNASRTQNPAGRRDCPAGRPPGGPGGLTAEFAAGAQDVRSEEHTTELQSLRHLV